MFNMSYNGKYICPLTGLKFDLNENDKHREGGLRFGINTRTRALVYALNKNVFNVNSLSDFQGNKKIFGIGMSDQPNLAHNISQKCSYTNTFYHTQPFLDINDPNSTNKYNNLDFILSSDVFEHISPHPGLQYAFDNMYKMLKPGGHLIFSVPFHYGEHLEHFPSLYNYSIKTDSQTGKKYIENYTIDGKKEIINKYTNHLGQVTDLCFHGGKGAVLECRVYSKDSLFNLLTTAGFKDITIYDPAVIKDMNNYGIFWENNCSLIMSALK